MLNLNPKTSLDIVLDSARSQSLLLHGDIESKFYRKTEQISVFELLCFGE